VRVLYRIQDGSVQANDIPAVRSDVKPSGGARVPEHGSAGSWYGRKEMSAMRRIMLDSRAVKE